MIETPVVESTAATLRQAFDLSFSLAPSEASEAVEELLAIRVAGDPYAIRLRDIAAVVAGCKVVPVPAAAPDLLGLSGIRGGVVPVFGLQSLLGYGQAPESPGWMVLCGVEEPIALAFSELEDYLQVPKSSLLADEHTRVRPYLQEVASTAPGARAVIDMPLVVTTIRNRIGRLRPARE